MTYKALFLHDVKLSGDSDFAQRFNDVSDLWQKANDESMSEEERKEYMEHYWAKKYCLEQGIG